MPVGSQGMAVHCLIPVRNRLDKTTDPLRCLRPQDFSELSITIVDDGSTDVTPEVSAPGREADPEKVRDRVLE